MRCQDCELLLAGDEDALAEDHLRDCAECRALQKELRANALALNSFRDEELPSSRITERRAVLPWLAAAAAAVLLVLIVHQTSRQRPIHPQQASVPMTVAAKLPPKPALKLPVRRKPKPASHVAPGGQLLLVKMLTPDPDVVVYWLVD